MRFHTTWALHDASQVGEARRAATILAESLGLDATTTGRVALVATELGTNLVRHARGGRLLLCATRTAHGTPQVELLSLDDGPGMGNVAASMADGFSTGGTPGNGLGAVRRMSDQFDLYSQPGQGTVVLARIGQPLAGDTLRQLPRPRFATGGVAVCAPGEAVCGDAWAVHQNEETAAVLVADGLGHGPDAAEAANAAVALFDARPFAPPTQVLEGVHTGLRATRGAAVAMAHADAARGTVQFAGMGNISGRLLWGTGDRSLLSQHGTAGVQVRKVQAMDYDWPEHALLVLHSDGIATRWTLDDAPGLLRHPPTTIAAWLLRSHIRGKDDASVVVVRREES